MKLPEAKLVLRRWQEEVTSVHSELNNKDIRELKNAIRKLESALSVVSVMESNIDAVLTKGKKQ